MDTWREQQIINAFGKNLRKIRLRQKLSLRKLADLADMNYGNIGKIERGLVNPQISTVILLAEALGVNPAELLPPT